METDLIELVRANADGMMVLDEAGDIRHANPAAARLLGRTCEELLGQPFGIPLAPRDAEAEPAGVEIGIHRPAHPGCPTGTAELRCSPCRWAGQPATLVSLRDVTERKALAAELREGQRRLRRLSSALQQAQLAERMRVSDQLKEAVEQPLRAARAEARAAASRSSEPHIEAAAERVVLQLDEALRAATETREELFPPGLDKQGLVAATKWLAGRYRDRHRLCVQVRAEPDFREPEDDRLRGFLFLAVRELLQNVRQHAGTPNAEVRFSSGSSGDRIQLEVVDRGVGYATTLPDDADRSARRPLRGLGLFNLQETVLHRGGELKVVSGPGGGTRVQVQVPRDAMEGEPGGESFSPPPVSPSLSGWTRG